MNRGSVFFDVFLSKKTSGDFVGNVSTSISSADSCSFTFTGKEKDSESGYHYFGARYYDSEALTMWLSVDPMSDKYPSLSPYNYCAWNPVKLVDPDGREGVDNDDIIIRGTNNSCVTIKTDLATITMNVDYDFGGNLHFKAMKLFRPLSIWQVLWIQLVCVMVQMLFCK